MKTRLHYEDVAHIDKNTGEVICETHGVTTIIDTRLSEKEIAKKKYEENHIMDFCKGAPFIKFHTSTIKMLKNNLTDGEFCFFMCLCPLVSYDDCILRATGRSNSTILNTRQIAEKTGYEYESTRKYITSLKKKGIIGLHETGSIGLNSKTNRAFIMNPFIVFRGRDVNKTVASLFEKTGWAEKIMLDIKSDAADNTYQEIKRKRKA